MINEFIHAGILSYSEQHSSAQASYLDELLEYTKSLSRGANMVSGFYQGRLLALLSKMQRPKRILDIGMFTGFSALCLAEGLQRDGSVITIDNDPRMKPIAQSYFQKSPFAAQIDIKIGAALEIIDKLEGTFDLVFIDAAKKEYIAYFDRVAPLLGSDALIIADNILWKGQVLDEEKDPRTKCLHEFNRMILHHPDFDNIVLPIRDGLMLARKV